MSAMNLVRRSLIVGWLLMLCIAPAIRAQTFSDQSVASGLVFSSNVLADIPFGEHYAGGAVGDFNRDGAPDVILLGGGGVADALFINNGDGTFTNRAAQWGVDLVHRSRAASVGDYNADGWPDIYITSGGDLSGDDRPGEHVLYRNDGGTGFTDVADLAGVNFSTVKRTSTGSAWGDYDLDGDLDLMVMTWDFAGAANRLFRNNGDETFTDVTSLVGIQSGWGFTPRFVDMTGDRYPELLLVSDFGSAEYYLNGTTGGFTDQTGLAGTGLETNGMGTAIGDFNRDGHQDWYCTSIYRDDLSKDGNYLYVNQGDGTFAALPSTAGAQDGGWGWGVETLDFDHDGFIDIAETNGWDDAEYVNESSYLFRNNGDMTFTRSALPKNYEGRSLMTLDYDLDGDMDLLITAHSGPSKLWRNDLSGAGTHWLKVVLDSAQLPGLAPDGVGARVVAQTGVVSQYFYMSRGGTFLGQSQRVAHFGLADAADVDQLTVEWANGMSSVLTDLPANQSLSVTPSVAGSPGEVADLQVGIDRQSGRIDLSYSPSCDAVNHTLYYGDLDDVASDGWSGAICGRGRSGATSFHLDSVDRAFFVLVGNTGLVEGSYGLGSDGGERMQDVGSAGCDLPQDLTAICN
jgi:hypothetical protein